MHMLMLLECAINNTDNNLDNKSLAILVYLLGFLHLALIYSINAKFTH